MCFCPRPAVVVAREEERGEGHRLAMQITCDEDAVSSSPDRRKFQKNSARLFFGTTQTGPLQVFRRACVTDHHRLPPVFQNRRRRLCYYGRCCIRRRLFLRMSTKYAENKAEERNGDGPEEL